MGDFLNQMMQGGGQQAQFGALTSNLSNMNTQPMMGQNPNLQQPQGTQPQAQQPFPLIKPGGMGGR